MRPSARQHDVVYLFLDAIYLKLHPDDEPAEGVLVAWGVTLEGTKILLGLTLGSRESYASWLSFGRDLVERGMNTPALVVADGAPGLWKAASELWPPSRRAALHRARAQKRDRKAARAPPPRSEGQVVEDLRRGGLARRGAARARGDHRRLPRRLPIRDGSDRARHRHARLPPALALRAPQTDPLDGCSISPSTAERSEPRGWDRSQAPRCCRSGRRRTRCEHRSAAPPRRLDSSA